MTMPYDNDDDDDNALLSFFQCIPNALLSFNASPDPSPHTRSTHTHTHSASIGCSMVSMLTDLEV